MSTAIGDALSNRHGETTERISECDTADSQYLINIERDSGLKPDVNFTLSNTKTSTQ